jgi:hypothetical protein
MALVVAACGGAKPAPRPSPTPTGQKARVVSGVTLVPALGMSLRAGDRGSLARDSQRTARRLGFPAPCPELLPESTSADVVTAGTCPKRTLTVGPGCDGARRDAFASLDYPDPTRPGHIVIFGSPTRLAPEAAVYAPLPPPRPLKDRRLGRVRVRGQDATAIQVAPSSETASGGHVAVVWTERGHTYLVSVHGTGAGTLRLTLAIARSVRLER